MQWTRKGKLTALLAPTWRPHGEAAYQSFCAQMAARANELRYEGLFLASEERQLTSELDHAEPESALRRQFFYGLFWAACFTLTTLGTFCLALWALRPFALGYEGYMVAGVATIVAALAMEVLLSKLASRVSPAAYHSWLLALGVFALVFALTALAFLAHIRAGEMAVQGAMTQHNDAVTIEGEGAARASQQQDEVALAHAEHFSRTLDRHSLAIMLPLAMAVELIAGICLHGALTYIPPAWMTLTLYRRRRRLRHRIATLAADIENCPLQPEIARYELLQEEPRGAFLRRLFTEPPGKLLVGGLILLFLAFFVALFLAVAAAEEVVIVGLDETTSSARAEFAYNLQTVEATIATLQAGTHFVILPITAVSFSAPILLEARLSPDEGLFGERVRAGRHTLLKVWQGKAKALKAEATGTDLFGACAKAAILFAERPGLTHQLILLSDMRQAGRGYDFEKTLTIDPALVQKVHKEGLIPSLPHVTVWAWGVHTAGVSEMYWASLKTFWQEYFRQAGAELVAFSPHRTWQR